ncbi:MAG: hypothetical protein IPK74_13480 [Deltaproteobacteria bacterium]|nr:hypothetical protein [Deltaproteobacteria bacterium]
MAPTLLAALALAVVGLGATATARAEPEHRGPEEDLGSELPPGGRVLLPERLDVRRSAKGSDRSAAPPGSSEALAELGLRSGRDGRLVYTDGAGRFTAIIDHDGTVFFGDRYRRPHRRNRQRGRGLGRPPEGARGYNPFIGLRVPGPSEWAIRATRRDPAASAKAQFLTRTEPLRRRLATAAIRASLQQHLHALPGELAAIWSAPQWSPAQRRKQLFARWDECDEADAEPPPTLHRPTRSIACASMPRPRPVIGSNASCASRPGRQRHRLHRRRAASAQPQAQEPTPLRALRARRRVHHRHRHRAGALAMTTPAPPMSRAWIPTSPAGAKQSRSSPRPST